MKRFTMFLILFVQPTACKQIFSDVSDDNPETELVFEGIGCGESVIAVDDQSPAKGALYKVANPDPKTRNFVRQNKDFKVLLGLMDTGIDYNHPSLRRHIHFDLDESGKPIGTGYDYLGKDRWPAPYIIRTDHFNPLLTEGSEAKVNAKEIMHRLRLVAERHPQFVEKLPITRIHDIEANARVYHGTNVAGLMVYDRPDFGLVSYRIFPHIKKYGFWDRTDWSYSGELIQTYLKNFESAVKHAHERGVRVMNIPMFRTLEKSNENDEKTDTLKEISLSVKKIMERYPRILFVVPAGNTGKFVDNNSRFSFPCSIDASNLVCVGALRSDGVLADFSSIPLDTKNVIYAEGKSVYTTTAQDICLSPAVKDWGSILHYRYGEDHDESIAHYVNEIHQSCQSSHLHASMSGTGLASGLVSRYAATILANHPDYDAKTLIREMKYRAKVKEKTRMKFLTVQMKRPSWDTRKRLGCIWKGSDILDQVAPVYCDDRKIEDELYLNLMMHSL